MTLAPLPADDVSRIVQDALGRLDLKALPAFSQGIAAEMAERLRFDHEGRRFVVVDDAGNPAVDVDRSGRVHDVSLGDHLRALTKSRPYAFAATSTAAGAQERNPFLPGPSFSRTRQALLQNADPEAAARLEAEAANVTGRANPWTRAGWNRTDQALMRKSDPTKAERLAAEAGVAVNAMRPA